MEMVNEVVLELVEYRQVTDQVELTIGYESISQDRVPKGLRVVRDHYGRYVPAPSRGTAPLSRKTSSLHEIEEAVGALYNRIVNPHLQIRRISLSLNHLENASETFTTPHVQLDLFSPDSADVLTREQRRLEKEQRVQEVTLKIKKRFGKNALLKGLDFEEGATARERNGQIGGHKA